MRGNAAPQKGLRGRVKARVKARFEAVVRGGCAGRGLIDNGGRAHYVETGRKRLPIRDDTGLLAVDPVRA